MPPIHQRVVAQQAHRHQRPPLLRKVLSKGDPRVAVRRTGDRLNQRHIAQPWQGRHKKFLQRFVRVLLDAGLPLRLLLGLPARFQIGGKIRLILQRAVAECLILQRNSMGDPALVKFNNPSLPDPLPQLRDIVCRPCSAVTGREEKRQLLPLDPFQRVRDVHVGGSPHIGIRQTAEIFKMRPSREAVHIEPSKCHLRSLLYAFLSASHRSSGLRLGGEIFSGRRSPRLPRPAPWIRRRSPSSRCRCVSAAICGLPCPPRSHRPRSGSADDSPPLSAGPGCSPPCQSFLSVILTANSKASSAALSLPVILASWLRLHASHSPPSRLSEAWKK